MTSNLPFPLCIHVESIASKMHNTL
jgi:hypothetical protein